MNSYLNNNLVVYIISGIVILMLIWNLISEKRWKKLFRSNTHEKIDDVLIELQDAVAMLGKRQDDLLHYSNDLNRRVIRSLKGAETLRFNAWGDASGNQSFAIALVDEEGNGIIISSLYARERMNVFAKPIKNWQSENELTEEEIAVLEAHKRNK